MTDEGQMAGGDEWLTRRTTGGDSELMKVNDWRGQLADAVGR